MLGRFEEVQEVVRRINLRVIKIEEFIPVLNSIFEEANSGGMITMEKASIIKHKISEKNK